ncbi:PIG-P, partial [Vararia minispora EC-137]
DDAPTSPTEPLAPFPPVSSRSRTAELYGFVALSTTYVLFAVYVLWALLPSGALETVGIRWYPDREWALRIPAWTLVAVLLAYSTHLAIALHRTPPLSSPSTLSGPCAHPRALALPAPPPAWRSAPPTTYDVPITLVNHALLRRPPA